LAFLQKSVSGWAMGVYGEKHDDTVEQFAGNPCKPLKSGKSK